MTMIYKAWKFDKFIFWTTEIRIDHFTWVIICWCPSNSNLNRETKRHKRNFFPFLIPLWKRNWGISADIFISICTSINLIYILLFFNLSWSFCKNRFSWNSFAINLILCIVLIHYIALYRISSIDSSQISALCI